MLMNSCAALLITKREHVSKEELSIKNINIHSLTFIFCTLSPDDVFRLVASYCKNRVAFIIK